MLFTVTQYLESVLNSRGLTRTLGEIDVCRTADGRPVFHTGNSAVIFRIRLDGRDRLLKCYTRPHRHLEAIYGDRFRPAELFLYTAPSEGMWADVVVDDWIEGETLTRTLDRAAANGDKPLVARLAAAFDTLAARLLPAQWAHGDLKPDNLIWDGQRLRPIDFDAMFLPEFRGRRSPELGTRAFQHPARTEADFDASLDDYPAALIATVLHAAAHDPSLLVRYPAEGLVLDPSAVIEGRSEAYREMLDAFARRGDAVGYRTAQLLRSPVAKLPQAASLFAWRLRAPPPLPPLRIVGKVRDEHHRVARWVQVALLDLRGIGRIALGQQFGADVDDFYAEIVQSFVDLNSQLVRSHRAFFVLVPQFGLALAMEIEFLPQTACGDAGVNRRQAVLFWSSFSHQEKDGKSFLSHNS